MFEFFMSWFECAEDSACGCALALIWPYADDGWRMEQLLDLLRKYEYVKDLIEESEDIDRYNFEKETNFVEGRAVDIFGRERCGQEFVNLLGQLIEADIEPELALRIREFLSNGI
jgi:hypothetical protein